MAIIVSDSRNASYTGNLSTVNGFYRVEAGNLGCLSNSVVASLTSTVNYTVTFANAGNCMGIVLPLAVSSNLCNRPIKVELQELVGGTTWTARTSTTLTAIQIECSSSISDCPSVATFLTPFKFATPYAVTTSAGIWRFQITSTAGTGNWNIKQAVAGTPSWITWCDNAISWTNNADQFVAVDDIIIDQATTFLGALATGDAVNAYSGWICSGSDKLPANCPKLKWAAAPLSSYKLVIKGLIATGSNSGFAVGTALVPILASAMAEIEFVDAAVGTNISGRSAGFCSAGGTDKTSGMGGAFLLYGQQAATMEDTELAAPAAAGQPVIVTKDVTGWLNGTNIVIGRQTTKGNTDPVIYTVSSVAVDGVTVTLTTNLTAAASAGARSINASVFRLNKYGIKIYSATTTATRITTGWCPNNRVFSGCEMNNVMWVDSFISPPLVPVIGGYLPHTWEHCSYTSLASVAQGFFIGNPNSGTQKTIAWQGDNINHVNFYKSQMLVNMTVSGGQGIFTITNCIFVNHDGWTVANYPQMQGMWTFTDNKIENCYNNFMLPSGYYCTVRRNKFWGGSGTAISLNGMFRIQGSFYITDWGENTYDNCNSALLFGTTPNFGLKFSNDEFGQVVANTIDVSAYPGCLTTVEIENNKGNVTPNLIRNGNPDILLGTEIRMTKNNQVDGADTVYSFSGTLTKCGTGLSDMTYYIDDFCLKFVPYAPTTASPIVTPLSWIQKIPTENIQNKDMMVGIWVNIANAAYWAGTPANIQMPRVTINYDNGTLVYGEAAQVTGWQFIFAPFKPATTYGEITVTISGKTDCVAANAAFYVARMSVLYPAGHNIEMGKLNTWSSALPTMPSISTTISAGDVWAVDPTIFGASTVGAKVNSIKNDTGIIPALL